MAEEVRLASGVINCNCGVLGHVDSGKTSLVKALSTSLSTCALDKHPQSQQRGITLDLGFSAFTLPMPEHLQSQVGSEFTQLQFTLVDCPGHASLIRTIIGGAQIIDMMLLVVDANKGIQAQTAECIVIAEITTDSLIVVLNKIDALPLEDREARLEKVTARVRKTLAATKFKDAPIVLTAAAVGGEKVAAITADAQSSSSAAAGSSSLSSSVATSSSTATSLQSMGMDDLLNLIRATVRLPQRNTDMPFYFAIDHCFPIKGHGTVLTGTVLSGSVSVNTIIELPELQQQRKVKSMQMFRRPVKQVQQGDRVGICVKNLDSTLIERGIAAAPGSVPLFSACLCLVKKVRFFRGGCRSGTKFHVSIGHTTLVAETLFFGAKELQTAETGAGSGGPGPNGGESRASTLNGTFRRAFPRVQFDWAQDFEQQEELAGPGLAADGEEGVAAVASGMSVASQGEPVQWALLKFQQSVHCPLESLIIGSRLDGAEGGPSQCRLAFFGPIVQTVSEADCDRVRLFSWRLKQAEVHKVTEQRDGLAYELIGWKLFSEGGSVRPFLGLALETANGEYRGIITAPFGAGGKFKVKFARGVPRAQVAVGAVLTLNFKRFVHDKAKAMRQGPEVLDQAAPEPTEEPPIHTANGETTEQPPKETKRAGGGISLAPRPPVVAPDPPHAPAPVAAVSAPAPTPPPPSPPIQTSPSLPEGARLGSVESIKAEAAPSELDVAIVAGAFAMEEDIRVHAGKAVVGPQGQRGELKGPFAKLGKCKATFPRDCGLSAGSQVHVLL